MKKIWVLAKHNLKKEKGQYMAFGIILFMTALILNIALVLLFQMDKAYDKKFDELDTANVNVIVAGGKSQPVVEYNVNIDKETKTTEQLEVAQEAKITERLDEIEKEISQLENVEKVEVLEAIFLNAIVKDFRGTDFDMNTVFYNMDEVHELNRLEIIREDKTEVENPIYLPLYIAEFGQFDLGDTIVYQIEEEKVEFTVAGVVQEMQYGNLGNGIIGVYLPKETYTEFVKGREMCHVTVFSAQTKEQADSEKMMDSITSLLTDADESVLFSGYDRANKQVRTMVCNLLVVILAAFAVIVLLVSLLLCRERIQNRIEAEMTDMGVLKALGYTGNGIIAAMMLPYGIVGILTVMFGIGISYILLPVLVSVIQLQAGFWLTIGFDAIGALIVVVLLLGMVFFFTYFAARKIKKLQPIWAIRGISQGKIGRKNVFALQTTKGNVHLLLAGKNMYAAARQNLLLFLVLFVLTILISFAGVLFYNVMVEPDNFMSTLAEESPDAVLTMNAEDGKEHKEAIENMEQVSNVLEYSIETVQLDKEEVPVFVCEDFNEVTNDLCYEGKNPENDDEIAIGNEIAQNGSYEIGDSITLTVEGKSASYKIVGFLQSVNYQGKLLELTKEGYEKICTENPYITLYVYLNEKEQTESFLELAEDNFEDGIVTTVNFYEKSKTSQELYAGIVQIVVLAVFLLTILIALLILFILIRSLLVQRRQELGIYKAIGYSNRQLMFQMAGSFLPTVFVAIFGSAVLGKFMMPTIYNGIFSMIGVMKHHCEISAGILLLFAGVLFVATFFISMVLSMPIKKISAYALIKE